MEIKVKVKTVYGKELVYPACDKAQKFADMLGKKTLSKGSLEAIKDLGYMISVEVPTI